MWDVSYLELNTLMTATLRRRRGKTTKLWWWLRETGNWEETVGKRVPKKTAFTRSFIRVSLSLSLVINTLRASKINKLEPGHQMQWETNFIVRFGNVLSKARLRFCPHQNESTNAMDTILISLNQ